MHCFYPQRMVAFLSFRRSCCQFCNRALSKEHPFLYCKSCQAHFILTNTGLKYEYIKKSEVSRMKLCSECESKTFKFVLVPNFEAFLDKTEFCSKCRNRNISILKDKYFTNLDKKCVYKSQPPKLYLLFLCFTLLCLIWDKSIFLLIFSIFSVRSATDACESFFLLLSWPFFQSHPIFYILVYILQVKRIRNTKTIQFEIDPESKALTEQFNRLKI